MDKQKVLIDFADFLIEHYNPCGFHEGKCLVSFNNTCTCCFHTRFGSDALCPYLINNKCTNPNLSCKCWYCQTALDNMTDECKKAVYSLESIAIEMNLMCHPYLGEKYYGADRPLTD